MQKNSPSNLFSCIHFSTHKHGGFTIIEMIVSIGIFSIILLMASSAFLTIVSADRKSREVRIATDNLNLALEDMQRKIKTGSNYYCGEDVSLTATNDCPSGNTKFSFLEQDGLTRTVYEYDAPTKAIYRTSRGLGTSYTTGVRQRMTAPEININDVKFIVNGSLPGFTPGGDSIQAYVNIVIDGSTTGIRKTSFSIQSTVTQRNYDS